MSIRERVDNDEGRIERNIGESRGKGERDRELR